MAERELRRRLRRMKHYAPGKDDELPLIKWGEDYQYAPEVQGAWLPEVEVVSKAPKRKVRYIHNQDEGRTERMPGSGPSLDVEQKVLQQVGRPSQEYTRDVLEMMPITGDAMQAYDAYRQARAGNWLMAGALAGGLFLPNVLEKGGKKIFRYLSKPYNTNIDVFSAYPNMSFKNLEADPGFEKRLQRDAAAAYMSGQRDFSTIYGMRNVPKGQDYKKYPSWVLAELDNTVIPRLVRNRPWMKQQDIDVAAKQLQDFSIFPDETFDVAGYQDAAGLTFSNDAIAIRAGYAGSEGRTVPHEVRHRIDHSVPLTEKEDIILSDAYDNDFIEVNSWMNGRKYDPSNDRVTTNADARAKLLGPVHLRNTPIELQDKMIDKSPDERIFKAVEESNGYGRAYMKRLRRRGLLTPERANKFRDAMKWVGVGILPIATTAAAYEQNEFNSGKDSGIHIKPSKRGTFTAAAKRRGMTVKQLTSAVLRQPGKYSKAMRKKAQFARNASKWKK